MSNIDNIEHLDYETPVDLEELAASISRHPSSFRVAEASGTSAVQASPEIVSVESLSEQVPEPLA